MESSITKTYEFGVITLYHNYLVAVMNQGITVITAYNEVLENLASSHFQGRPFGYITHRKNSYAVDPNIYTQTSKIKNLVAFAVVSQKTITAKTVAVEKMFMEKPFQLFTELNDAIDWVKEKIKNSELQ